MRAGDSIKAARWLIVSAFVLLLWPAAHAVDKSAVSANTISLPSGPGAVEGLGESFQPAPCTGAAQYGVGLRLMHAAAGHVPALSLDYSSDSGNGPLGLAWSMTIPHVQRRTDFGIPRYVDEANGVDDDGDGQTDEDDEVDAFIDETSERLVHVGGGDYRCRFEDAFIRYRREGDHWVGDLPEGTHLEFGVDPSARITDESGERVFCWMLEKETDRNGNTIRYFYTGFPGDENRNQKYLSEIRYGPGSGEDPPWPAYHFVSFRYEEREDWFEDCRSGFAVRTGMRLAEIVMGSQGLNLDLPEIHARGHFNGDQREDFLNWRYALGYEAGQHVSVLTSVTWIGADDETEYPPLTFGYASAPPSGGSGTQVEILGSYNEPTYGIDNPLADLVDLNGDALPDLLKTDLAGGTHTAYLNQGETEIDGERVIQWSDPLEVHSADGLAHRYNLADEDEIAFFTDLNGDAQADFTFHSLAGDVYYFPNRAGAAADSPTGISWGPRTRMFVQDANPPSPFGNPNVLMADIDFDKRTDIIESVDVANGADYRIWYSRDGETFSRRSYVAQDSGFLFSWSGVDLADLNGDRVPDVVRIRPTGVQVTVGFGHGHFGPLTSIPLPDAWTLTDDQVARAGFEDLNGDGFDDLVVERPEPGVLWYWLNRGNYSFAPRGTVTGLPGFFGANSEVRWADLNGDDWVDLIYADSTNIPKIQTVDVSAIEGDVGSILGRVYSALLTSIDNGIGARTEIEYGMSTDFYLEDWEANGWAEKPWPYPLPFALEIVSRVIIYDSLGNSYDTDYVYHDGYYDALWKQFRGFGRTEQFDNGDETQFAPTLVTEFSFHLGQEQRALKAKLRNVKVQDTGGGIFSEKETVWEVRELFAAQKGKKPGPGTGKSWEDEEIVEFAIARKTINTERERQEDPATWKTVVSESDYDAYGNQTLLIERGVVADPEDQRVVRSTVTEMALNLDSWLLRYPMRTELRDPSGTVVTRSEYFYDDPDFGGDNLGDVSKGNLSLEREWVDPADLTAYIDSVRVRYDVYGNAERRYDPLADLSTKTGEEPGSHYRHITYDPNFHAFPTVETIYVGGPAVSLALQATYDEGFGTVLSSTDFNGNITTYRFDPFARLTAIRKPLDTDPLYPTVEHAYFLAQDFVDSGTINYIETRTLDTPSGDADTIRGHYAIKRQYIDGMGRTLLEKEEGEPDPLTGDPRVVASKAVRFNAREMPRFRLQPFYTRLPGATLDELLAYEDIGAEGWTGAFHVANGIFSGDGAEKLEDLDFDQAHKTSVAYDGQLRVTRITNPDGTYTEDSFEPLVLSSYDENDMDPSSAHFGTPFVRRSDGLGRMVQVDEVVMMNPDGSPSASPKIWATHYTYDENDNLARIVDAQGNERHMGYDGLLRRLWVDDPDAGRTENVYDPTSNLVQTTDAKSQVIHYRYDGVNRLLAEDYPGGAGEEVLYRYDVPEASVFKRGKDGDVPPRNTLGYLVSIADLSGEEHSSYDERGRVEWVVKKLADPDTTAAASYTSAMEYDSMDRVTKFIYPDGDSISYTYTPRGRISRISGGAAANIYGNPFLVDAVCHTPSGQVLGISLGNGLVCESEYDERRRLKGLASTRPGAGVRLLDYRYEYDNTLNIMGITDARSTAELQSAPYRRNSQSFAYDDRYRVKKASYSFPASEDPGAEDATIDYRYDAIGNMLSKTSNIDHVEEGISLTDLGTMTYDDEASMPGAPGPHALTRIDSDGGERLLGYDANGNVVQMDALHLVYDAKDRLTEVTSDTHLARYTYDYADSRVIKRVWDLDAEGAPLPESLETTHYIDDNFEVREHEQPVKYVWAGEVRLARVVGMLNEAPTGTQSISVAAGWNLFAVELDAPDTAAQLGIGSDARILNCLRWNGETKQFDGAASDTELPAGIVCWLESAEAFTLELQGNLVTPETENLAPGQHFVSAARMGAGVADVAVALQAAARKVGFFDAAAQVWRLWQDGAPGQVSSLPDPIAPDAAFFIETKSQHEPAPSPSALRIQYYLQDHLKSSNILTDARGNVLEETAFYPFGAIRYQHRSGAGLAALVPGKYLYAQQELDRESGLTNFGARHMAAPLGRFVQVDPLLREAPEDFLDDPQLLNPYAYSRNNPLLYSDPSGNAPERVLSLLGGGGSGSTLVSPFSGERQLIDTGGMSGSGGRKSSISIKGGGEGGYSPTDVEGTELEEGDSGGHDSECASAAGTEPYEASEGATGNEFPDANESLDTELIDKELELLEVDVALEELNDIAFDLAWTNCDRSPNANKIVGKLLSDEVDKQKQKKSKIEGEIKEIKDKIKNSGIRDWESYKKAVKKFFKRPKKDDEKKNKAKDAKQDEAKKKSRTRVKNEDMI